MSTQADQKTEDGAQAVEPRPADEKRRKVASAGLIGTGVMLSVASRSAMGGWGQCTGSEVTSSNLSRTGESNPCGCSPGYWWNTNGINTWTDPRYSALFGIYIPSARFNTIFGVTYFTDATVTLGQCGQGNRGSNLNVLALECPDFGGNGNKDSTEFMKNVATQAVAALLNAAFYGNRYPVPGYQTPQQVIANFQAAFNSPASIRCAQLKAFVTAVDVYDSRQTWCLGEQHTG